MITSDIEGDWPLTVIEAAAYGVPVISLNFNYGELIDKYKAGFYCEGDLNKMNFFFQKLMNDNDLLKETSNKALKYVKENHNIKANALQLAEWLNL